MAHCVDLDKINKKVIQSDLPGSLLWGITPQEHPKGKYGLKQVQNNNIKILRDNVSKNLPSWNLGGRQIVLGPFLSDSPYKNRPIFQLLRTDFDQNFRLLVRGVSKQVKIDVNSFCSLSSKFHPICMKFISKIKNNVSYEIQVDFSKMAFFGVLAKIDEPYE